MCMGTPYGMLLTQEPMSPPMYGDYTMWTSVGDHTNLVYHFVSAFNAVLASIPFSVLDFDTTPT
jgi:hypothetical protein